MVQVDPVELFPQVRVGARKPAGVPHPVADIVHQHIDAAVVIEHRARERGDLVGFPDVGNDCQRRLADLPGGHLRAVDVDICDDHLGAVLGQ